MNRHQPAPGETATLPEYSGLDADSPNYARVQNFLLNGKDNYSVDREFAGKLAVVLPEIQRTKWAAREFLLATARVHATLGIRQFCELGAGMPSEPRFDCIVHDQDPDATVLYVDNDAVVAAHNRAMASSNETGFLLADIRKMPALIEASRLVLDFSTPIAMAMSGVLEHLPDLPQIVQPLFEALPPRSVLIATHIVSDVEPEVVRTLADIHSTYGLQFFARHSSEVRDVLANCGKLITDEPLVMGIAKGVKVQTYGFVVERE